MSFLIDGHNLIPKLGIRLESVDDEEKLISRLLEFCRQQRTTVEVFFDAAPAGHAGTRKAGAVTAHFIHLGSSADAAIENRLSKLGKAARNWTVVSSDRRVIQAARAVHAGVKTSDEFARMISFSRKMNPSFHPEDSLPADEVEEWLKLFNKKSS
jgi:predicted RNA-binding protein with PIN domain